MYKTVLISLMSITAAASLLIFKKVKKMPDQNAALLAIATELKASQEKLAADLQKVIDAITASTNAGAPVSQDNIDALQTVADAFKSNVDAIDAAVNPVPTTPTDGTGTGDGTTTPPDGGTGTDGGSTGTAPDGTTTSGDIAPATT